MSAQWETRPSRDVFASKESWAKFMKKIRLEVDEHHKKLVAFRIKEAAISVSDNFKHGWDEISRSTEFRTLVRSADTIPTKEEA